MAVLEVLSAVFGWVYFLCWSGSFYPQPLLNWGRGSTSGTTVDFPFLNVLGFAAYFASNAAFYYSPTIRAQYAARHNDLTPTVAFNDVVFALNGLVLSVLTASQYLLARPVWGFAPSVGQRPSGLVLGISHGCVLGVLVTVLRVGLEDSHGHGHGLDPARAWCALDIVYAVGYVKLVVTLVKYVPQMLANWRNKSTRGWSIWQILLDFSGGVLSIAQQGIDSWLQGDWAGITGNPVKFALGNASMAYDVVFMAQHYVLYAGAHKGHEAEEEEEAEDAADVEDDLFVDAQRSRRPVDEERR